MTTFALGPERLSDLIADAYQAALEPAGWSRFLAQADGCFGSDFAVFSLVDHVEPERSFAAMHGIDTQTAERFRAHHGGPGDFWWQRLRDAPAGSVSSIAEALSPEQMRQSPLYEDVAAPGRYEHFLGSVATNGRETSAYLYLIRTRDREDFELADKTVMRRQVLPHLQRSLAMARQVSRLKDTRAALWSALDHSPYAIVVLDSRTRALFINRRAAEVFRSADGLVMRQGQLVASDPGQQSQLDLAIATCLGIARGAVATPPPVIQVLRPSGASPLQVACCPVTLRREQPRMPTGAACLLLIRPAATRTLLATEVLAQVYALSPAELRLCQALLEHGSLTAAVAQLHVSHNTGKTQLRSVYLKTGARTQIDLLRLLTPWSRSLFG